MKWLWQLWCARIVYRQNENKNKNHWKINVNEINDNNNAYDVNKLNKAQCLCRCQEACTTCICSEWQWQDTRFTSALSNSANAFYYSSSWQKKHFFLAQQAIESIRWIELHIMLHPHSSLHFFFLFIYSTATFELFILNSTSHYISDAIIYCRCGEKVRANAFKTCKLLAVQCSFRLKCKVANEWKANSAQLRHSFLSLESNCFSLISSFILIFSMNNLHFLFEQMNKEKKKKNDEILQTSEQCIIKWYSKLSG